MTSAPATPPDAVTRTVVLCPERTILVRDARPFSIEPGARAATLDWPLPRTAAGALRAHIGDAVNAADPDNPVFAWRGNGPALAREIPVRGPLLIAREVNDAAWTTYLPAPRDAVVLRTERSSDQDEVMRLRPIPPGGVDGATDLPAGLRPLSITEDGKPSRGYDYWSLGATLTWLASPDGCQTPVAYRGHVGKETTIRVAINPGTRTVEEGALFSVTSLNFPDTPAPRRSGPLLAADAASRPAQAVGMVCSVGMIETIRGWQPAERAVVPFGGERRTAVATFPTSGPDDPWPSLTSPGVGAHLGSVAGTSRLRLQLVSPALFDEGWRPGWLDRASLEGSSPGLDDLRLRLVAVASGRRIPVTGWSIDRNRPGPTPIRYAMPAGSVLFFEVIGGPLSADQAERLWMVPLSDDEQDRLDGFGLAIPGVWADAEPDDRHTDQNRSTGDNHSEGPRP